MSTKKQKYIKKIDKTKDKIFVYTREDDVESRAIEFILREEYKIKSLVHHSHGLFVYSIDGSYEIPNMRFIAPPSNTKDCEDKETQQPEVKKEPPKRRTRRTRKKSTQDT